MSISFFDAESVGTGSLPFANDYLDENPRENGKLFSVKELKLVQSGKGYLGSTDKFTFFLWKNSKTTKQIVEALEYYTKQAYGYELVIKLDKTVKGAAVVGVDSSVQTSWYALGNGFTTQEGLSATKEEGGNPFLLAVPPIHTTPMTSPSIPSKTGQTTKKRRSASQKPLQASPNTSQVQSI